MFVHRAGWAILPGIISGLLVAGMSYGAIVTKLDYVTRDIEAVKQKNQLQDEQIDRNRELIYLGGPE